MADEHVAGGEATGAGEKDPLVNLKAEMERKLANRDDALKGVTEKLEALSALLTPKQPPPKTEEPDLQQLMYSDPVRYNQLVVENARAAARAEITGFQQQSTRQTSVIAALTNEFPELQSMDNKLTQKALEIYNTIPPEERNSPIAYKTAVYQAATELNVKPKKYRSQNDTDDFVMSGSSGAPSNRDQRKRDDLDPLTIAAAQALGQNTDDPKYIERLKKAAKRKNWNKYA